MRLLSWLALPLLLSSTAPPQQSEERAVGAALDAFHLAAHEADAESYFGAFAPEGVFMGTDPAERWTVDAFRQWARPYFQGDSAWTFVPRSRHIDLSPERTVAWFDEVLDSESYGECRGTGVLRRIGPTWKIAHYNLSIPVPNALARDLVRRIRKQTAQVSVVFLVRHAEKRIEPGQPDPELTEAGRRRAERLAAILADAHLDAIFATGYRRTQQTVAPIAQQAALEPVITEASDVRGLAREILTGWEGERVLACGHSNTLPPLLTALGVETPIRIEDEDYDDLFIVMRSPGEQPGLLHLHY